MAGDLRLIIGALKASDDLERIGNHAANVAKRSIALTQAPPSFSLVALAHMADLVRQNLHRMVTALDEAQRNVRLHEPPTAAVNDGVRKAPALHR